MKKKLCAILCAAGVVLTGCGGVELTEHENDVIAEYAATLLLKYSNTYESKLQDAVLETEPETSVFVPPTVNPDTAERNNGTVVNTVPQESEKTLAEAMGIAGEFEVEYAGYEIMKAYPNTSDAYFVMTATGDDMLLIAKFNITNRSAEEKECDVLSKQLTFRCRLNREERFGSQLTMLLDDLYAYKEILAPGETKQAVLIFQIPSDYQDTVQDLSLVIKNGTESNTYQLESSAE